MSAARPPAAPADGAGECFDVVVIGFGAAGACAAIEAADRGARVLVLERFEGGGASKRSGGVIYAGGGSELQRSCGFDDDPDAMAAYLVSEAGRVVDPGTLEDFCRQSLPNLEWLQRLGLRLGRGFHPGKATQPPDGTGLYFSGNERQRAGLARPAPRGHLPAGRGLVGDVLFGVLARAALARGVEVRPFCRADHLLLEQGAVVGVEAAALRPGAWPGGLRRALFGLSRLDRGAGELLARLERSASRRYPVRARGGVVIAAGGFAFNRRMMRRWARPYAACMPLGTPGDDGAGVRLGLEAGAALGAMDACAAQRFYCPPDAFARGLLVNQSAERFCDESLYGATLGRHIAAQPGGRAWLIIDRAVREAVERELAGAERLRDQPLGALLAGKRNGLIYNRLTAFVNLHFNRLGAATVAELARRCRMPAGALERTLAGYHDGLRRGTPDAMGKPDGFRTRLDRPPFWAVACHLDDPWFLAPCFTLGGLRTEGRSAQVLAESGDPIPGLYAAGRSAVGVCSRSYISGLSLADCVFSGRRAGQGATLAMTKRVKIV